MQIVYMNVHDLNPYKNNPRKNDQAVAMVKASIQDFGFKVPITIDKDKVVVTGHTRLKAAIQLGMTEVPCIILDDLTQDQVKAFRLVDNRTSEIAEWDYTALEIELEEIKMDMSEFDFKIPGVEEDIVEDDYEVNLPGTAKSRVGEIYKLGRHILMCGDTTNSEHMKKLMNDAVADLIVTDPPYNVDYETAAGSIMNDKLDGNLFQKFLTDAFITQNSVLKKGGTFYIWHSDAAGNHFRNACDAAGWKVRQCLIWKKNAFTMGRQDYQWKHEPCLYGWKDGAAHYFVDDRGFSTIIEDKLDLNKMKIKELKALVKQLLEPKVATTIIAEDKPSKNAEYPTMKPVKIIGRMISNSSKRGEIILDAFAGSGTAVIAAEQLGRTCYMMELDPKYVDVIIDRFQNFTGVKAERIQGGDVQ